MAAHRQLWRETNYFDFNGESTDFESRPPLSLAPGGLDHNRRRISFARSERPAVRRPGAPPRAEAAASRAAAGPARGRRESVLVLLVLSREERAGRRLVVVAHLFRELGPVQALEDPLRIPAARRSWRRGAARGARRRPRAANAARRRPLAAAPRGGLLSRGGAAYSRRTRRYALHSQVRGHLLGRLLRELLLDVGERVDDLLGRRLVLAAAQKRAKVGRGLRAVS